jgi:aminoglycoside phosphotransferase family enzyme/adenylate kinase family enzyme
MSVPKSIYKQPNSSQLIRALQDPGIYDHPVKQFSLIETHISWVILTGSFAYKIKKPVNLGFVDFSTLEKRHYFCVEELRLNRRFAPDLYLDVVAIRGSHKQPSLEKDGEIIEYAVKMREFSQRDLLDSYASAHRLEPDHIDSLADVIADFHRLAPPAKSDSVFGSVGTIKEWTRENFVNIEAEVPEKILPEYFQSLKKWCLTSSNKRLTNMIERHANGFVRECHGDLHLGNIALIDDHITPFDCIEFNPNLRWIDTTSEIAFVVMDLYAHGYPEYAWQFINRYFHANGDYAGIGLLRYYFVYRATVRAKVEALRLTPENPGITRSREAYQAVQHYLDLAQNWASNRSPAIIVMHGLSGSGKSTLARHLSSTLGAIQIRSDVERKRMFGLDAKADSGSEVEKDIYSQEATNKTYDHLEDLTGKIIESGFTAIVDASFLKLMHRQQFSQLALNSHFPFVLVSCEASSEELASRIEQRIKNGEDPSEANLEVLNHQLQTQEAISEEERNQAKVIISTGPTLSPNQLHDLKLHINAC